MSDLLALLPHSCDVVVLGGGASGTSIAYQLAKRGVDVLLLEAGDIGTVVHVHKGGAGYEVEIMTLAGETVAVVTLRPAQVRSIRPRDVAHVRELAATGS